MESRREQTEPDFANELLHVFGEGAHQLMAQITHDNPALSEDEVVRYAWTLIPEATAYMGDSRPGDLTNQAVLIHQTYEAERRTQ
jgi:hypothetical protein